MKYRTRISFTVIDTFARTSILKHYRAAQQMQWWSSAEIEQWQQERLRVLLKHVSQHSRYYQRLAAEGEINLDQILNLSDLASLPVLRRADVAENYAELAALNAGSYRPQARRTGGTTGEPLRYLSDLDTWSLHWALKFRDWEWAGARVGEPMAVLAGSSLIPGKNGSVGKRLWTHINGFVPMSAVHLNPETMDSFARTIAKRGIRYIRGYPTSIATFARHVGNSGYQLRIKAVFTTAEVLQLEHREVIERVFKCPVFDTYGCADGGGHAAECSAHDGFHLSPEAAITEIVDADGNPVEEGEVGELVFTSLSNYAMPMLRYAPGDLAVSMKQPCQCGRALPKLKRIIGRTTEIIYFANGRRLGGPALTLLFREFDLKKYQVRQEGPLSIRILVVPMPTFHHRQQDKLKQIMQHHCGDDVSVTIERQNDIPTPPSGKFRFVLAFS